MSSSVGINKWIFGFGSRFAFSSCFRSENCYILIPFSLGFMWHDDDNRDLKLKGVSWKKVADRLHIFFGGGAEGIYSHISN